MDGIIYYLQVKKRVGLPVIFMKNQMKDVPS